ncbi:MAG: acetate--CoA ligase [Planctomycetes bacterium]|nr:acetate--CoA ligase [Planctomycetota bacterium]
MKSTGGIQSIQNDSAVFQASKEFAASTGTLHVPDMAAYQKLHEQAIKEPEKFWGDIAKQFHWYKPWSKVLEWKCPDAKWFSGGTTNACFNAVDRIVAEGHGNDVAILWEGEPAGADGDSPEIRKITYAELQSEVCRIANALKHMGVRKGDVVTLYMGMVPELAFAVLACARIGAPHSVIFGGFAASAIVDRVHDAGSKVILTCDGAWRRGSVVPLKENVDKACEQLPEVKNVLVLRRCGNKITLHGGRDQWWHEAVAKESESCPCEPMEAEDLLFLLYTSGSTGKPKGIRHTTGGYMVYTAYTAKLTFNLLPNAKQVFWCTADIGWVTGHSYVIYGILPNRVTTLMFEGAPNAPKEDRFWRIIQRHKVTHFYTAPTAIRAFMKWGDALPAAHDLSSLQLLGSVGEPINPEAWMWYREKIGHDRCPIMDTFWQTESGGHLITPLPGCTPLKPGSCTLPFPGVDAAIVDEQGNELSPNSGGLLVIRKPWPGMLRGIHGDRDRFIETYWKRIPGMYLAGDGARRDGDGFFWIMGRIDDVLNVSGHRLGTAEVESSLVGSKMVVEAAVVGMPHEIKGTGIAAFCVPHPDFAHAADDSLRQMLMEHVAGDIGAIARPDMIRFTNGLPKTRSGKIMRRLLRDVAAGKETTQDVTTLEDFNVLAKLRESEE